MAVNFSAADILDTGMLQHVLEVLRDTQVPAGSLTVEITESVLLHEPEAARRNMELLRVAGVRFSIDDFGTGYSSLSQLRDLAADELKIDQSFVRRLTDGTPEHQAVIRAIVDLAHGLGLRTVAEGVETEAQWRQLVELGCDYAQGYLTGKPQAADDLVPLLRTTLEAGAADSRAHRLAARAGTAPFRRPGAVTPLALLQDLGASGPACIRPGCCASRPRAPVAAVPAGGYRGKPAPCSAAACRPPRSRRDSPSRGTSSSRCQSACRGLRRLLHAEVPVGGVRARCGGSRRVMSTPGPITLLTIQ